MNILIKPLQIGNDELTMMRMIDFSI